MKKWFILNLKNQKIEEVKELPDYIFLKPQEYMLWSKPFEHWFYPQELEEKLISLEGKKIQENQIKRIWFYQKNLENFGPFTEDELLLKLKPETELEKVWVFSKINETSESIFKFESLLKSLGIQVRKNPRILYEGKVIVNEEGRSWPTKSITLSTQGIGLKPPDFKVTSPMSLRISIKNQEVRVQGEVIYQTSQMLGIKFKELDTMSNSTIISFLREILGDSYHKKAA